MWEEKGKGGRGFKSIDGWLFQEWQGRTDQRNKLSLLATHALTLIESSSILAARLSDGDPIANLEVILDDFIVDCNESCSNLPQVIYLRRAPWRSCKSSSLYECHCTCRGTTKLRCPIVPKAQASIPSAAFAHRAIRSLAMLHNRRGFLHLPAYMNPAHSHSRGPEWFSRGSCRRTRVWLHARCMHVLGCCSRRGRRVD